MPAKPSYKPVCPNHGEPLEGCGFPLPAKGVGKCPVSGVDFEFEAETDEDKIVTDKFGNVSKSVGWRVDGDE
jgi:hypothetical protein